MAVGVTRARLPLVLTHLTPWREQSASLVTLSMLKIGIIPQGTHELGCKHSRSSLVRRKLQTTLVRGTQLEMWSACTPVRTKLACTLARTKLAYAPEAEESDRQGELGA